MNVKNILLFALVGAIVGVLIAEYYPNIGHGDFKANLNDLAFAFGRQKPYPKFGAIGAALGALIGFLSGKK